MQIMIFLIGTIMVTEGRMETWVVDLLPQPQESTNDTHQEAEVSVFYVYYCFQNLMLLLCTMQFNYILILPSFQSLEVYTYDRTIVCEGLVQCPYQVTSSLEI